MIRLALGGILAVVVVVVAVAAAGTALAVPLGIIACVFGVGLAAVRP